MNNNFKLEGRASRGRGQQHEGESSIILCDRLISWTRAISQRQLPTDHDCAVSAREYQIDQSSLISDPAAAGSAFEQTKNTSRLRGT
jgi:hypothetical protein